MTHFFNNDVYEIVGNYEIIGKVKVELNVNMLEDDWCNWDLLVLRNLENYDIEIKYCRRKGLTTGDKK